MPDPATSSLPRRIAAFFASHLLGVTAHAVLSPVVVGYTMLILGTLGFALVGGGINEEGLFAGLATFTAVVCLALLAAVLSIDDWAGDPPLWQRVLQGAATTVTMASILFIASAPGVLTWFGLREARGPVAAAIAGRASGAERGRREAADPTGTGADPSWPPADRHEPGAPGTGPTEERRAEARDRETG